VATIIPMPIEKREPPEPPQPIDDWDRWVSVAFVGIASASDYDDDLAHGSQQLLLWTLLEKKFADVPDAPPFTDFPDAPPSPDDTAAFARYAVKRLLKALTASGEEKRIAAEAAHAVFERLVIRGDWGVP
jgi:hypothetical protein